MPAPNLNPVKDVVPPEPVWKDGALVTRCPRCLGNERPGAEYQDGSGTCGGCGGKAWVVLARKTAQRCPVCGGCGTVQPDFYERLGSGTSTMRGQCRACSGSGVVYA